LLGRVTRPVDKGFLYKLLNNRVYIGDAVHKGTAYSGEHEAIVSRELWEIPRAEVLTCQGSNVRGMIP
jgi:site-specific DNA recombinase